jgi:hypothetical protein
MISKKYIKLLGFDNIERFYSYVVESKINGALSQCRELIKGMNKEQVLDFKTYLDTTVSPLMKDELIQMILEVRIR